MDNARLQELLEKAKAAKSPEELLSIAKENDYQLTEEEANAYFEQISKSGELTDEELDNVAGGGAMTCYNHDRPVISVFNHCDYWTCSKCNGLWIATDGKDACHCGSNQRSFTCRTCKYKIYEGGLWMCDNPIRRNN